MRHCLAPRMNEITVKALEYPRILSRGSVTCSLCFTTRRLWSGLGGNLLNTVFGCHGHDVRLRHWILSSRYVGRGAWPPDSWWSIRNSGSGSAW
ncbi:hypothetical protein DPEC_G00306170 [Dallia pectoralis]|uniref:Uncharacterized protein n=1 Tax=Dallia pectoralis TaxID=75939 RepID=A0ACC2FE36_DALPE|nr:hypothetical protein DPEC_G00306170 [Dallia pectoralis]